MAMTSIGDIDTARMLFKHYGGDMQSERRAPNGFKRVGRGAYRMAVLDKRNHTVYKVGCYYSNTHEARLSRKLRSKSTRNLGFDLIVPRTRTYRMPRLPGFRPDWYDGPECVSAQEYTGNSTSTYCASQDTWKWSTPDCDCAKRSPVCFGKVHDTIIDWSGLEDIHADNILMDSANRFWLVDMGC